jgi:hypothetical protein
LAGAIGRWSGRTRTSARAFSPSSAALPLHYSRPNT